MGAPDGHRHAAPDERRRVGHDPHDARATAESGFEAREREPGCDRHEEYSWRDDGTDLRQHLLEHLRLDGKNDDAGAAYELEVVAGDHDLVRAAEALELRRHGIA